MSEDNRLQPSSTKPRSLKPYILERGCTELQELASLRIEGWQDEVLKNPLDQHFSKARQRADKSTAEDDAQWLQIMFSILQNIDKFTRCVPSKQRLRFLDLGCCPGGFSKFVLTKNPNAQGVGVSLEVSHGGFGLALHSPHLSRFEMYWGDLTFYNICAPMPYPVPGHERLLSSLPFSPKGFQLAMVDGHHRRPQECDSTHPWDIDRLLISQLIISLESLDLGGTLLVKLHHAERSTTGRILYMLDNLSTTMTTFKPDSHATRSSFYAISTGMGLGENSGERGMYVMRLKQLWWELTFGGPGGEGRWLEEDDLDFIVDFDTLRRTYLDRLIELGRAVWHVQRNALQKKFTKIRRARMVSGVKGT